MNRQPPDPRSYRRIVWFFCVIFAVLAILIFLAWREKPLRLELPKLSNPFEKSAVPIGYYRVVSASDGDTIVVDMGGAQERIRMIGVDTPETHHPELPVQCFGEAAAKYTKDLLEGGAVRLEADTQSTNRDRYQRLLRYVYTENGVLVNKRLIEDGYGFAYLGFPFDKSEEFRLAEQEARKGSKGLWGGCTVDENHTNPQTIYPQGQLVP